MWRCEGHMCVQSLGSCPASLQGPFRQSPKPFCLPGSSTIFEIHTAFTTLCLRASYGCKIKPAFFQWLTKHSYQPWQVQFKFWHVAAAKDHMGVTESTECFLGRVQDIWTIRKRALSVGDGQSIKTEMTTFLCKHKLILIIAFRAPNIGVAATIPSLWKFEKAPLGHWVYPTITRPNLSPALLPLTSFDP